MIAVVVSCLPSLRLLSVRSQSNSAYTRRNPSSDRSAGSNTRKKPPLRRTSGIRLEIINANANLGRMRGTGDVYDQIVNTDRGGQTNTYIAKSDRTESHKGIVPPGNRVLVEHDIVSEYTHALQSNS